jgi:hypothetical protein
MICGTKNILSEEVETNTLNRNPERSVARAKTTTATKVP